MFMKVQVNFIKLQLQINALCVKTMSLSESIEYSYGLTKQLHSFKIRRIIISQPVKINTV